MAILHSCALHYLSGNRRWVLSRVAGTAKYWLVDGCVSVADRLQLPTMQLSGNLATQLDIFTNNHLSAYDPMAN